MEERKPVTIELRIGQRNGLCLKSRCWTRSISVVLNRKAVVRKEIFLRPLL